MPLFNVVKNSWARAALIGFALVLAVARARGQTASSSSLRYTGSGACPGEATFRSRLAARLSAPVEAWSRLSLSVDVIDGAPARGVLLVTDANGSTVRRDVEGTTCDDVVSAIALMTAVLLEGQSRSDAPVEQPAAPAAIPASSVPPPPVADAPLANREPPAASHRLRWGVGAHAVLIGGVGPSVAAGVRGMAELGLETSRFPFNPALRLSFAWAAPTHVSTSAGETTLSFLDGRAELCPTRLGWQKYAVVPCASFDVGRISANPGSGARGRLWLAPGLVMRAVWSATRFLDVEAEGGLSFPLMRYHFDFEPAPLVYQVPGVAGSGGIGAVLRFP